MPVLQPDESDYLISPAFSFVDATQENRKHPAELVPGKEMQKLTMFVGERDVAPSWPWPSEQMSFDYTLHGNSPSFYVHMGGQRTTALAIGFGKGTIGDAYQTGVTYVFECADWFEVGAYLVLLGPDLNYYTNTQGVGQGYAPNTYSWTSPGILSYLDFPAPADETNINYARIPTEVGTAFDVYYDVQTTILLAGSWGNANEITTSYTNRYYTSGGWLAAAGVTEFWWAIQLGMGAVAFDSTGIGRMDWTGDLNIPISYRKALYGFVTAGWPVPIGNTVFFIDTGGCLFATDGSVVEQVDGPFSAKLIPELASVFPSADVRLIFDDVDHRILAYVGPAYTGALWLSQDVSGVMAMIDFKTGKFQCTTVSATLQPMTNVSDDVWTVKATSTGTPEIITGGIQLTKPEYETIVHYVDLDVECAKGTQVETWIRDAYDSDDTHFVQVETVTTPAAGRQVVRIHANRTVDRAPQFWFKFDDTTVRAWGIERVAYNNGGVRN